MSENSFQITRSNFIIFIIGCIAVSSLIISVTNIHKTDEVSTPTIKYNGTDVDFKDWFKSTDGGNTVFGLLNEGPAGTDLRGVIKKFITPMGDVLKNIDSVVNTNNTHISNLHDYINGIYYQNYSLNYCAGGIDSHCSC